MKNIIIVSLVMMLVAACAAGVRPAPPSADKMPNQNNYVGNDI